MLLTQVNLWAVILGATSNVVLGSLWYGPFFGKIWLTQMGLSQESMNSPEGKRAAKQAMIWAVVVALIMSYVLADLMYYADFLTLSGGLQFAALIWLGFIATTQANNSLFEKRKWTLYLIGVSYQLVALVIMAAIISSWK